ncbi:MAG: HepT-like ribonuclease domain-containing protein [Phycisphaerales bacterium]
MRPESRKLLVDMRDAVESIGAFVTGKRMEDFKADDLLRSGVYFQFLIIGEALSQLRAHDDVLADRISEQGRIIGFRNQIIHGYSRIDDEITWRIVQDKLSVLRRELDELLAS